MSPNRKLLPSPADRTPPTREEVTTSAKASPLVASLARLREYIGCGLLLTDRGGFSVAAEDACRIVGSEPLIGIAGGGPLFADPKPRLRLLVATAIESGAIDDVGDRLVRDPGWEHEDPVVRADAAVNALLDLGPLRTELDSSDPMTCLRDAALDADCMVWMAELLVDGRAVEVHQLDERALDLCHEQFRPSARRERRFEHWVRAGLDASIDTLVWSGVLSCTAETVRLTALGRYLLPDRLDDLDQWSCIDDLLDAAGMN